MSRAGVALLVGFGLVMPPACGDGADEEGQRQCSLLEPAAIADATGTTAVTERPFEHEESGDGWWCLYEIDGRRIEVRFDAGDQSAFDALAAVAGPNGDQVEIDSDLADGSFRRSNGVPGLVVLSSNWLIQFNELDGPDASDLTLQLARIASDACCPG